MGHTLRLPLCARQLGIALAVTLLGISRIVVASVAVVRHGTGIYREKMTIGNSLWQGIHSWLAVHQAESLKRFPIKDAVNSNTRRSPLPWASRGSLLSSGLRPRGLEQAFKGCTLSIMRCTPTCTAHRTIAEGLVSGAGVT